MFTSGHFPRFCLWLEGHRIGEKEISLFNLNIIGFPYGEIRDCISKVDFTKKSFLIVVTLTGIILNPGGTLLEEVCWYEPQR